MPDIKSVFASEIRRLAKKEVKTALQPLHALISTLRKTIAAQATKIKALEKRSPAVPKPEKTILPISDKPVRISPVWIIKLRQKLGLSQSQFAALLDASNFSVSHWENGKAAPREAYKRKIAALRGLGKRELNKLLTEKGIVSAPAKDAVPALKTKAPAKTKPAKVKTVPVVTKAKPVKTKLVKPTKVKAAIGKNIAAKPAKVAKKKTAPIALPKNKVPVAAAKAKAKPVKAAPIKTKVAAALPQATTKPAKIAKKKIVPAVSVNTEASVAAQVPKKESEPAKS